MVEPSGLICCDATCLGNDGMLTFYLKVPARYSGDNFQVEVTKCDYSGNVLPERVTSMSPVYTSWKRVFVEKDRMFRRGGLLAGDVAQGANTIYLAKTYDAANSRWVRADNVQLNDRIAIFDTQATFEGAHDEACVIELANENDDQVARVTALLGTMDCQGGNTLARGYMASVSATGVWDFSTGRSAGVGVIANPSGVPYDTSSNQMNGTGSAFYDADMRDIEQPFSDGYLEFVGQRDGVGAVPYLSAAVPFYDGGIPGGLEFTRRRDFRWLWMKSSVVNRSYFYLLGVRGRDFSPPSTTAGITDAPSDFSYVYAETVATWGTHEGKTSQEITNAYQGNTDHELGHQFWLNRCSDPEVCPPPPPPDPVPHVGKHDYRAWWQFSTSDCPNSNPCLMDPQGGNLWDTTNRFCKEDLLLGDPTTGCATKEDSAIRIISDPIP